MGLFGRTSLAAVLVALVLLSTRESQAGIQVVNNGESHDSVWKTTDVRLYLDPSLDDLSDASESMALALSTWSADSRLPHVSLMSGKADSIGYREGQTNRSTVRFVAHGAPLAKGALAITQVSYDAEECAIVDGDIVLNGIYTLANLREGDALACAGKKALYDLTDVLTHEVGHWFGLPDNPDDPLALMYPYFDPSETRTLALADSDRQALDQLYSGTATDKQRPAACSVVVPRHGHESSALVIGALLGFWMARRQSKAVQRFRK